MSGSRRLFPNSASQVVLKKEVKAYHPLPLHRVEGDKVEVGKRGNSEGEKETNSAISRRLSETPSHNLCF